MHIMRQIVFLAEIELQAYRSRLIDIVDECHVSPAHLEDAKHFAQLCVEPDTVRCDSKSARKFHQEHALVWIHVYQVLGKDNAHHVVPVLVPHRNATISVVVDHLEHLQIEYCTGVSTDMAKQYQPHAVKESSKQ